MVPRFCQWALPEEIVKLAPLLIGSRSGLWHWEKEKFSPSVAQAIQEGLVSIRLMDISATDVRLRLKEGLYCGHLVMAPVLGYIREHGLYGS